jgi:hypothetical protein
MTSRLCAPAPGTAPLSTRSGTPRDNRNGQAMAKYF